VVAELMRKAIEERSRKQKVSTLIEQMLRLRDMGPTFDTDQIRKAREEGRP